MLSIDEAIEDFKTMAKDARGEIIHGDNLEPQEKYYNSQIELCAKEKEHIAEWLEELKAIKDGSIPIIHGKAELELHDKAIRNKAIDDFIHECDKYCGFYNGESKNLTREDILKIAEKLKVRG